MSHVPLCLTVQHEPKRDISLLVTDDFFLGFAINRNMSTTATANGHIEEGGEVEMDALDRRTRFQVNPVDVNAKAEELENLCNG